MLRVVVLFPGVVVLGFPGVVVVVVVVLVSPGRRHGNLNRYRESLQQTSEA